MQGIPPRQSRVQAAAKSGLTCDNPLDLQQHRQSQWHPESTIETILKHVLRPYRPRQRPVATRRGSKRKSFRMFDSRPKSKRETKRLPPYRKFQPTKTPPQNNFFAHSRENSAQKYHTNSLDCIYNRRCRAPWRERTKTAASQTTTSRNAGH
jgi:hypothetical protein